MIETTFELIVKHRKAFAQGLWITAQLVLISWFLGIVIGSLLGILSAKSKKIFGVPFQIFSIVVTSVPILVSFFGCITRHKAF